MNALTLAKKIEEKLTDNIRNQTLRVEEATKPENGESPFTSKLDQLFRDHPLVQNPYLELTPPYVQGCSLQTLVEDGCIIQQTADIFARYFGGNASQIHLHKHQEDAVRAACRYNDHAHDHAPKNMVVCAGTGSGKTECFLIPVIDTLLRMSANNDLEGQVYVTLLYPMNALVNDQLTRLRKLLKNTPIRFGKFTGELKSLKDENELDWSNYDFQCHQIKHPAVDHQLAFDGTTPLENELTLRSQWLKSPGHIMVTNYSMLERLLLNPQHSNLFTERWKYIVIDEAHSYNGSLGTDMAWLIRRLVHRLGNPADLRFLATSATLSNDPNIVRDEFAVKLFPAAGGTFNVIFGDQDNAFHPVADAPRELPDLQDIRNWQIAPLPFLDNETNLIKATQRLNALKEYNSDGLFDRLDAIANQDTVSFADAVFILKMLKALHDDKKIGYFPEHGFFVNPASLSPLLVLLKRWFYLSASYRNKQEADAFNIELPRTRDFWRGYLHDCIDARKSTYPGDNLANGRNPIGNHLDVLTAWNNGDFSKLDTLTFLLKIAQDCVFDIQQHNPDKQIPVGTIPLQFSGEAKKAIKEFCTWKDRFKADLDRAQTVVQEAWNRHINYQAKDYPIQLAWLLSGGGDESYPSKVYRQLLNRESPENTCFSRLVTALGFNNDAAGADLVDTLFALGSLARFEGSRFPLLDLRIHQFVRGLKPIGLYNLHQTENGQWDFDLTPRQEPEIVKDGTAYPVFNLGVCLSCGTPYILGYRSADGRQLVRYLDDTHPVMTAFLLPFSERLNNRQGGPTNVQQVYIDFTSGRITGPEDEHGENAVELWAYTANQKTPELLIQCLCCNGLLTTGNRYGLITPFEASSASSTTKLQMITVDTLAKEADPSGNPLAYALPGQGRKLLAFSDSRQGAARFAIRYQEYLASTTLKDLLFTLCREDTQDHRDDWERKVYASGLFARDDEEEEDDAAPPDFANAYFRQLCIFKLLMDQNRLTALLDLSSDEDLSELRVAGFRFLQALCAGGYLHNLIWNQEIKITSRRLEYRLDNHWGNDCLQALQRNGAARQLNLNQLKDLCRCIYRFLFLKCKFANDNRLWGEAFDQINIFRENLNAASACRKKRLKSIVQTTFSNIGIQLDDHQQEDCISNIFDRVFMAGENPIVTQDGLFVIFRGRNNDPTDITGTRVIGFDFELSPPENADAPARDNSLIPLTIQEHTAQISKKYAKAFQEAFSTGQVNILSCSTTFEMGVDLGDLNCLYLSNLPPSAANYRQRAGRAGRRAGSVAYVLTMLGSGENDDDYYFDHAASFIFGPVEPPRIYLDNPVYRARHLRAEALHSFWKYMSEQENGQPRLNTTSLKQFGEKKNDPPVNVKRNMELCSHFFAGYKVYYKTDRDDQGHAINGRFLETMMFPPIAGKFPPIAEKFPPIADNLEVWYDLKHDEVNNDIRAIADAGNVDYDVTADFLWQLTGGKEPWGEKRSPEAYGKLGGRKADDAPIAKDFFKAYENLRELTVDTENDEHRISGAAYHLMQEQTIQRLCRKRILPKYGFPVDVISLTPDDDDPYKGMTDRMEREKNIAIYEYAPGMNVVANKRIFKSASLLFSSQGRLREGNIGAVTTPWYRCRSCRNVFENFGDRQCPVCAETLEEIRVCSPDGFSAARSKANSYATPLDQSKGCRINTTFNEFHILEKVQNLNLRTATSRTAEIVYLNTGKRGNGFSLEGNNDNEDSETNRYYIYHKCMTDVVFWQPCGLTADQLFPNDHPRFRNAMLSTSYAIVKAAADILNVRRSEIGVISFPYERRLGFVLFDTTPGGNGTLTELALRRDENDRQRGEKIRRIIETALDICRHCHCNPPENENDSLKPASFSEYMQNREECRLAASCYDCLRDYTNQADHEKLDRYDAAKILDYILHPAPGQVAEDANERPNQEVLPAEQAALPDLPAGFIPMQEGYEPVGARCFMRNLQIIEFSANDRREDILGIEEE